MNQDVRALFHELIDLPVGHRERIWADRQIDPGVREEVQSLLDFDSTDTQIADCVAGTAGQVLGSSNGKSLGSCGPYRLVRLLGSGGMGTVYLGERSDGELQQTVAVKVLRAEAHRPAWRERFLRERQFQASLNHPSIVHVIDAGHTDDGRPYLVMEHVEGIPIDTYAAGIEIRERLALFQRVCAGVAHAHQHLIIHRDLKPSNILVDASGQPKVLDFGIAKLLDETGDATQTIERFLTPSYASPEQISGAIQTTATDVYSLGAVLYKLLTGRLPRESGEVTAQRVGGAAGAKEVTAPSRLKPGLPADLDYVVRKALRREPEERYKSVEALSDDIQAFLESKPVHARSGNGWYLARKFARRHWLPVSAVAAAILSLCAGLYIANREKSTAQRRFAQLRQLSNRVLALDGDIRALPGSTKAREKIVSVSKDYLDGLSREAHDDLDLRLDAANGYMLTAQVQGVPSSASLGKFKEADKSLAKAADMAESVLAEAPSRPDALLLLAKVERDRMIVADAVHDWSEEQRHAERSKVYTDRLFTLPHLGADRGQEVARIYLNIGQAEMNMHRYAEAPALIRRGIELSRASGVSSGLVAQALSLLANALRQAGDLNGALEAITSASALGEKAEFADEMQRTAALYAIWWRQGVILGEDESVSLERPDDAVKPLEKAFALVDGIASKDPNDAGFRERLGTAGQQLGDLLRRRDPARALAIYDRTLLRLREMKGNRNARKVAARVLAHSSYPLRALHRPGEAKRRIDQAFELLQEDPSTIGIIGGEWDNTMRALADYEDDTGHPQRAREIFLDLHGKLLAMHPNPDGDLRHAYDMSRLYESLARLDAALGNIQEQKRFQVQRMDLWRQWDRKLQGNSFVRHQLEKTVAGSISPSN